ncbi:unnamed protein product [Blepharisma stoltei]|uniref:Uncharacterized protein n=1 Tax=Blepharisma stoltei TaxID=1481888 RepID=A0AAU9ITZ1_9CILI|nr:unnamed protein product [Blepharisma stoltei]
MNPSSNFDTLIIFGRQNIEKSSDYYKICINSIAVARKPLKWHMWRFFQHSKLWLWLEEIALAVLAA